MVEFKVGDKIRVLVNYYVGCMPNGDGPKVGDVLEVVDKNKCTTPGNWIDKYTAEVDQVNLYGTTEFALVEKLKPRFAIGDRVISVKNTPSIPEGFIGTVTATDDFSFPIAVTADDGHYAVFEQSELELLSVGKPDIKDIKVRHDSVGLSFDDPLMKVTPTDFTGIVEEAEYTGGSSSYYKVDVIHPTTSDAPYQAECNDVIEALGLTFTEGNIFKAIWRIAADRQGKKKKGNNSVYDAEKVVFFAERLLIQEKSKEGK